MYDNLSSDDSEFQKSKPEVRDMNAGFQRYLKEMARQRKLHPSATPTQLRAYVKKALGS